MRIYWDLVISPLLESGQLRTIAEIGAERGVVTRELARAAQAHGGVLHSVDPAPLFDVSELQREFGPAFRFYEKRSLEALPEIGPVDLALIDGDHNWFTVISELRLLREAAEGSTPFPIVLLHDVEWPYGRRDLYYAPESIPGEFRHPHARGGLVPGVSGLSADGLNAHLAHAEFEGGQRNGVLTAVEDFLAEWGEAAPRFLRLPGLYGLGVLVVEQRLEDPELRRMIWSLESDSIARRLTELIERERVGATIAHQRDQRRLAEAAERVEETGRQLEHTRQRLERSRGAAKKERARMRRLLGIRADEVDLVAHQLLDAEARLAAESTVAAEREEELAAGRAELERLRARITALDEEAAGAAASLDRARRELAESSGQRDEALERAAATERRVEDLAARQADLRALLAEREGELDAERTAHEQARAQLTEASRTVERLRSELAASRGRHDDLEREIDRLRAEVSAQRTELVASQGEVGRFVERVEAERAELDDAARRLAASRSWRFGHGFFLALRRLRPGRSRDESALDLIAERLSRPLDPPRQAKLPPASPRSVAADEEPASEFLSALPSSAERRGLDAATIDRLAAAPPVTIVVPVHNAAPQVRRCIEAVARNTSVAAELLVIDDASTDGATVALLRRFEGLAGTRVVRNETNQGFTKTVNRGLAEAEGDVVLLNSDTEVGPGWLGSLRRVAYSAADIGSVTPLSDNAGAFSAPEVGEANEVPAGLSVDDVARLVAQSSRHIVPSTPTGSGFCLYLKREAIDEVGSFDAESFPRGYGEENDYCMRAVAAGWRHVIDDSTYVRHEREASFGEEKAELLAVGRRAVDRLHPSYTAEVRRFVRSPEMEAVRASVRFAFAHHAESRPRPRLLFVIHEGSGGTPATNEDLARALDDGYDCFVLTSNSKTMRLHHLAGVRYEIDAWALEEQWRVTDFSRPDFERIALEVLANHAIELVHVRHLFKQSFDVPRVARALGIPVVVSLHDFYLACPSVHLLDDEDRYCEGACTPGDGACRRPSELLADAPPLKNAWVHVWRERVGEMLEGASALVTTSPHARDVHARAYPDLDVPFEVIEHGRDFEQRHQVGEWPGAGEPLRVLIPGSLELHKGSRYVERLAELDAAGRLELHFLGPEPAEGAALTGIHHGRYRREEFAARAAEIRPAVVGVFSIWPETYCHVLTEAWAAGIPVVATDIGALGERMRRHGGGWLVPHDDPEAAYERLVEIAADREGYAAACGRIAAMDLRDTAAMARDYDALYRRVLQARRPFVAETDDPALATLTRRVARLEVCVPGRPGSEPGSSHVRVLRRLSHPAVAGQVQASFPGPEALLAGEHRPDALLVQRTALPPAAVPRVLERVEATETPLVVELDDDLLSLQRHPTYGEHVEALSTLVEAASLVTASTPALAASLAERAREVALVPNALDERLWFGAVEDAGASRLPAAEDGAALRVLYMGTRTHGRDLELLRPAVERLRDEAGLDLRLEVIGGEVPGPGQDWYTRLPVPSDRVLYPRFVHWLRANASRWDVAVAPLVDDDFNRCKSDLKFLEYAALGLPAVLSDVEAYRGVEDGVESVKVGEGTDAWADGLLSLAEDPGVRERLAAAARERVRASRCLDAEAGPYLAALTGAIEGAGVR